MRSSARRSDDADLIRARLRAVLAEMDRAPGWVPPDEPLDEPDDEGDGAADPARWEPRARRRGVRADPDDDLGGDLDGDLDGDPDEDLDGDRDDSLPAGLGRHRAPGVAARLDPGRPGAWALWLAGVLAAVLVVGWTWVDRPEVEPAPVDAPSSSAPPEAPAPTSTAGPTAGGVVVVSVVGQVVRPGLVTLPAGSRVADALTAAGGLLPDADPASVNAAAPLTDGQQIAVGVPGAAAPPASVAGGAAGASVPGGPLHLNTATVADLDALPGIGPVLAQRIVDHRSAHGPFTSVAQLEDVPGIGPTIFADLEGRVTV